jgi:hypothetical protein
MMNMNIRKQALKQGLLFQHFYSPFSPNYFESLIMSHHQDLYGQKRCIPTAAESKNFSMRNAKERDQPDS